MKIITTTTLTLLLVLAPSITFATEGQIVEYKPNCNYFLIVAKEGYLFVKKQSKAATASKKGDIVEGSNLGNYGITSLHNNTINEILWIYNENAWLSKVDATNKYVAKCGPIETHPIKDVVKKTVEVIGTAVEIIATP